ncbi:MAG: hypothetical protein H0S79_16245, partial [Anaerolineaceae bacterium]|nr:hypothetical protein [Anaerolineaceae bacterium]
MKKKKKSGLLPILLLGGVIIISIVGLAIASNARQANIDNPPAVSSQDDVVRVTAEEAYQAQQEGAV